MGCFDGHILATNEPTGLLRGDEKRPDGISLVPWQGGQHLTWDATVVDTFASSYSSTISTTPGGVADKAATRIRSKYFSISQTYMFNPVALESMGPINAGLRFLDELSDRLISVSGDPGDSSFLFQRLSVLTQRFNMIAFRGTSPQERNIGD